MDNGNTATTMTHNTYIMSFTAGAILYRESLKVARLHETVGDWQAVRTQVMDGNVLQMRTPSAAKSCCGALGRSRGRTTSTNGPPVLSLRSRWKR